LFAEDTVQEKKKKEGKTSSVYLQKKRGSRPIVSALCCEDGYRPPAEFPVILCQFGIKLPTG